MLYDGEWGGHGMGYYSDYSVQSGYFLPLSGGQDSSSVALMIRLMCEKVCAAVRENPGRELICYEYYDGLTNLADHRLRRPRLLLPRREGGHRPGGALLQTPLHLLYGLGELVSYDQSRRSRSGQGYQLKPLEHPDRQCGAGIPQHLPQLLQVLFVVLGNNNEASFSGACDSQDVIPFSQATIER